MSLDDRKKNKKAGPFPGFQRALEGILERLRQGMEELANELSQNRPQPQPIPIPLPTQRRRRK